MLETNTKSGYVYILSNDLDSSVLKIGFTTRTPDDRCKELNAQTGVFFTYKVEHVKRVYGNAEDYEKLVHKEFRKYRVLPNKEHFRVDFVRAIYIVEHIENIIIERKSKKNIESLRLSLNPLEQVKKKYKRAKMKAEKEGRTLPDNFMEHQFRAARRKVDEIDLA